MQASLPFVPYSAATMSAARSSTRLRQLREAAGISLRELARQLGEDHSNVGFWERTGTPPRSNVLVPMAAALGVTVEELLGHEKPKRAAAPGGKVRVVFARVQKLPRRQQDKIVEVVEALLAQAS
jgi:transcriptional regulator with XRE-family HTH domain